MGSFSVLHWLIFAGILFLVIRPFLFPDTQAMICPACGGQGTAKSQVRGSVFVELILWLCFLVPGLIYSIWRASSRHKVCQHCGQAGIIPIGSPRGAALVAQSQTFPPVAMQPAAPGPVLTDDELMRHHGITFDGKFYIFDGYKYERLADVVTYARRGENR